MVPGRNLGVLLKERRRVEEEKREERRGNPGIVIGGVDEGVEDFS